MTPKAKNLIKEGDEIIEVIEIECEFCTRLFEILEKKAKEKFEAGIPILCKGCEDGIKGESSDH